MRILEVSRYKNNFADHQLPFVTEQGESLRQCMVDGVQCMVDYFLVKGNYIKAAKELRAKIEEVRPNIVHAHYGLSGITAVLAAKSIIPLFHQSIIPPKVVITFHNGETLNWKINLLTSFFSLFADHVIYVAEHIRKKLYFVNKHNTILPCGVPMAQMTLTPYAKARQQLGWSDDTKYILFGGAFTNTRKNVALLHEALNITQKGQSLMCKSQIEIIEMKGLSRPECVLRMCASDLFALPSKSEGSPQALKEAMACGCPCLATDIADVRTLLGDLDGNYICTFDPDDVAKGLQELLLLPSGYRTEGKKRIGELGYSNDLVATKLVEIYQSLLEK